MSEHDPGAPPTRTRNRLLVSVPALPDDNFDRTVVYMIDHEDSGAIGVVLNRPTGSEVPEELRIGPAWASPPVVFSGGPVSPEAVIMLGRRQLGARQRCLGRWRNGGGVVRGRGCGPGGRGRRPLACVCRIRRVGTQPARRRTVRGRLGGARRCPTMCSPPSRRTCGVVCSVAEVADWLRSPAIPTTPA
ncbi:MAG: YqgE/AlgH family protein [Microthrixaceae bacterium]